MCSQSLSSSVRRENLSFPIAITSFPQVYQYIYIDGKCYHLNNAVMRFLFASSYNNFLCAFTSLGLISNNGTIQTLDNTTSYFQDLSFLFRLIFSSESRSDS